MAKKNEPAAAAMHYHAESAEEHEAIVVDIGGGRQVGVATLVACSMFYFKAVTVKLLPFDNKSEVQLVADLPEGTPLDAAFRRMETDRTQEAETIRARGARDAQIVRANAEAEAAARTDTASR